MWSFRTTWPAIATAGRLSIASSATEKKICGASACWGCKHGAAYESAYRFFGRWLLGKPSGRFSEKPFEVESDEDLGVFSHRPPPKSTLDAEGITRNWISRCSTNLLATSAG